MTQALKFNSNDVNSKTIWKISTSAAVFYLCMIRCLQNKHSQWMRMVPNTLQRKNSIIYWFFSSSQHKNKRSKKEPTRKKLAFVNGREFEFEVITLQVIMESYNGKRMTGQGMNSASRFASTCLEWIASMLITTKSKFRSSATSPMMAVGLFPSPSRSSSLYSLNPPISNFLKGLQVMLVLKMLL